MSQTLTPMLCSRVLRPEHETKEQGRFAAWLEQGFSALTDRYSSSLVTVIRHPRWVMGSFLLSIVLTIVLYQQLPKDFLPSTDSGQLTLTTKAAPDTSFATLSRMQQQVAEIVRDDPKLFESKIAAIKEPAILISTGAVSKGVWDFIPESLKDMGATIHFHRVNIRPGKPVLFATLPNGSFYFGLPGNPISAAIGFTFFVMPLVQTLQGLPDAPPLMAALENSFTKRGDFRQFLKASVWLDETGGLRAQISDGQESFKISPMAANNAWVVLEEGKTAAKAGDRVPVVLYASVKTTDFSKDKTLCQAA